MNIHGGGIFSCNRTQKPASVMIWGAITFDGRTPLVFIDQGVKINKGVYVENILENTLKLELVRISMGRIGCSSKIPLPHTKQK